MRAEKAIRAMLTGAAGVTSLVSDRIYPVPLPQGCTLPAIAVEHVSTIELTTVDANSAYGLVRSRIQVTVLAKTYPEQKTLLDEVRKACNYQRGTFNGVRVQQVLRDTVGPDGYSTENEREVYSQSIDFQVTHQEP